MDLYTSREVCTVDNALKITNVMHPWRLEGDGVKISSSQEM